MLNFYIPSSYPTSPTTESPPKTPTPTLTITTLTKGPPTLRTLCLTTISGPLVSSFSPVSWSPLSLFSTGSPRRDKMHGSGYTMLDLRNDNKVRFAVGMSLFSFVILHVELIFTTVMFGTLIKIILIQKMRRNGMHGWQGLESSKLLVGISEMQRYLIKV